jgi:WD40 repeat protein
VSANAPFPAFPQRNPFPGLRPFEASEAHLFFGRDGQSDEMLRRLGRSRFLAVVGTSGSGKSSLVRAGLLPALHGGLLSAVGTHWRMAILRPGADPIGNLARSLSAPPVLGSVADPLLQPAIMETTLRRSARGLIEATRQARLNGAENLLVLVDQFEELFRFKLLSRSEDAAAFVKLLLESVQQAELPVYVVLTLRSDFLGECAQFRDLPEALNDSQYLVPRLTRDQRREAIQAPVAVGRGSIAPRLLQRLLNDVGDDPDQLPVLQHALMRTWDHWQRHRRGEDDPLDLADYEAIGSMREALSRHVDEAYAELPDARARLVAETLFKTLTERGRDNRDIRRPTTVRDIAAVVGADPAEVIQVIEVFRGEGRSFLTPSSDTALRAESSIDISHESLIRQWERLRLWVDQEAQSATIYLRTAEAAKLYEAGQSGLWRDPQLHLALEWRERAKPVSAWAQRYDPAFAAAMAFLDESRGARDAEVQRQARDREAKRRRAYGLAVALGGLAALLAVLAVWALRSRDEARRATSLMDLTAANLRIEVGNKEKALRDLEASRHHEETLGEEQQAERAASVARTPGREFEALVLAIRAAGPQRKRKEALSAAAIAGLGAAVTAARRSLPLRGHTGMVTSAAFSPTGGRLLTVGDDQERTATLWDVGSRLRLASVPLGSAWPVTGRAFWLTAPGAFSRDGARLIIPARDGTAQVLDARRGRLLRRIEAEQRPGVARDDVIAAGFSPTDRALAVVASSHQGAGFWNVETGDLVSAIAPRSSSTPAYPLLMGWTYTVFSSDGSRLLTGGQVNKVQVWDVASGQRSPAEPLAGRSESGAFSPDGSRVVITMEYGRVMMLDADQLKPLEIPYGCHALAVSSASFSPDSAQLVLPSASRALLLDAKTGKVRKELVGHAEEVDRAEFSPDGKLVVTASRDHTARLWGADSGEPLETLQGHRLRVLSAAFAPDGRSLVTTSADGTARVWDIVRDGSLRKLEPALARLRAAIAAHAKDISSFAFSADGRRFLLVSRQSVAWLGDASTGRLIGEMRGTEKEPVESAVFSPDGRRLLTGGNRWAIWDAATGRRLAALPGPDGEAGVDQLSRDGSRLVTADSSAVTVWDAHTGHRISRREDPSVWSAKLAPDGGRVLTMHLVGDRYVGQKDRVVQVWDSNSGRLLATIRGHMVDVRGAAFSPDGDRIVTASGDRTAAVWNARDGQRTALLEGHEAEVEEAAFSPDGARILTRGADRTARLWDAQTGHLLATLEGHSVSLTCAAFSADGRHVVTASNDGTAKIYSADPADLAEDFFATACGFLRHQPECDQVEEFCGGLCRTTPPGHVRQKGPLSSPD